MNQAIPEYSIERIELDNIETQADGLLGFVLGQPLYHVEPDNGFRIQEQDRNAQINAIERCFEIRQFECEHRGIRIPFIIFPELSIPFQAPDGLSTIRQMLEGSDRETIFIGGIEGLTTGEVSQMVESYRPPSLNSHPSYNAGAFVNVCVVAIRDRTGNIEWHFQTKLYPSQWEQRRNMARGNKLLYFHSPGVAFICQICFDHLAVAGSQSLNIDLCEKLESITADRVTLDYVFVPQYNPQPLHEDALESTRQLLNFQRRRLTTDMTSVFIVNRASTEQDDLQYGRSSMQQRGNRWQVPKDDLGPIGYTFVETRNLSSAVFRKRTASIHTLTLVPQQANDGNSMNMRLPLDNFRSYLLQEACDPTPCASISGTEVTPGVYVQCECLPCKLRDTLSIRLCLDDETRRWESANASFTQTLHTKYLQYRRQVLNLSCSRAYSIFSLLLIPHHEQTVCRNPDLWESSQIEAVKELLSCLCTFNVIELASVPELTAHVNNIFPVAILDGENRRFWNEVVEIYKTRFSNITFSPEYRGRKMLVVALRSLGRLGNVIHQLEPEITRPTNRGVFGFLSAFTTPTSPRLYVCQSDFFAGGRDEENAPSWLETQLRSLLDA
jgi:hypothetical protein